MTGTVRTASSISCCRTRKVVAPLEEVGILEYKVYLNKDDKFSVKNFEPEMTTMQ